MNTNVVPRGQFGPYTIEALLGVGGMAHVYRAFDPQHQRRVALKITSSYLTADPTVARRFQREAEIISQLRHPHIVAIYDFGEHKGRSYIAMQYMAGGSLAHAFRNPTAVSLETTARLLRQIADALDFAHQRGIVHRDIKLENILLDEKGNVAISDFGIAYIINTTRLTVSGNITGTPLYMSPEQARGEPHLDYRSDLYSFAVMAYLMATGYFPFTADTPLAVLNQHLTMPPPLPSQVNPALGHALDAVLLRGLAKDPDLRHPSATAFAEDFEQAIADRGATRTLINIRTPNPIQPAVPASPAVPQPTVILPPSRRPLRLALAVLTTAALFIFGLTAFTNGMLTASASPTPPAQAGVRATDTPLPSSTPTHTLTLTHIATPTDTPTATPTHTPTATPTPRGNAVVIGEQGLNLRQGAGTEYAVLATLPEGTPLWLIGRTEDAQWFETRSDGRPTGWVHSGSVEAFFDVYTLPVTWVPPTATPTPTPTPPPASGSGTSGGSSSTGGFPGWPTPTRRPIDPPPHFSPVPPDPPTDGGSSFSGPPSGPPHDRP